MGRNPQIVSAAAFFAGVLVTTIIFKMAQPSAPPQSVQQPATALQSAPAVVIRSADPQAPPLSAQPAQAQHVPPVVQAQQAAPVAAVPVPPEDPNMKWRPVCAEGKRVDCPHLGFKWGASVQLRNPTWLSHRLSQEATGVINSNSYIFDIGGNMGQDSAHYATRGATMHIFEPLNSNVATLKTKFASDAPRITIHHMGVGMENKDMYVVYGGVDNEAAAMQAEVDPSKPGEKIVVRDIVELIAELVPVGDHVFISMNCEGCEYEVFRRLATYDGGRLLRDGVVSRMNMALHGNDQISGFCTALPHLLTYYRISYCDGPWAGFIHRNFDAMTGRK